MANMPLSDVTMIATILGVFFLIVAFYKSIFHKRRSPEQSIPTQTPATAALRDDQPVKLADPFQQVPVDSIPLNHKAQPNAPWFFPAYPQPTEASVSVFRQFNPKKEFESTLPSPKNETAYEWE